MGVPSVRRRLVVSFLIILALFAVNQAIHFWGDQTRDRAIAALDAALRRRVLIASIHQQLADLQKEVSLLSEVHFEPGSAPDQATRQDFDDKITRLAAAIRELKVLDTGSGAGQASALEGTFTQVAELWKKFYQNMGVEQGWAVAYLARADPLTKGLLREIVPRIESDGEAAAVRARADFQAISARTRAVTLLILIVSVAIGMIVAIRTSQYLVGRLAELGQGADLIGEDNLKHRIAVEPRDEMGELAEHFNEMAANLDVAQAKLRRANAELGDLNMILSRTVEEELAKVRLAGLIQRELLPKEAPRVPGYDLAGRSIPAQTVGGDYFDFVFIDDRHLALCLGDVSGKGLPASLLMANLQASVRSHVLAHASVTECMRRTNILLFRSTNSKTFVTAFFCALDLDRHEIRYANAGHNPPLLFRSSVVPERLVSGGLVLGFMEDAGFEEATCRMEPDDLLVIYSDGVTEIVNAAGEEFGEEGITAVVSMTREGTAEQVLEAIVEATFEFGGHQLQPDDVTLIVLKRS
jgi:serine phosphatase RsbU (regulator of sigma subunit)